MKFITAILLGAVAFVEAKSTVFSPERTGAATANDPNPTANGANASDISIKKHGEAICPATNDSAAWKKYIEDGIRWLRAYKGTCASPPLPNVINCQRVSCSWASGIYLCNDSTEKWASPPCATIADYTQEIIDKCQWSAPDLFTSDKLTQGELWDDGGWHVYVGHANC